MTTYKIDAARFVQDHEVLLDVLDRPDWTDAQLESLEALERLLGELREKLLDGAAWDYTATHLEEARSLDCEIRGDANDLKSLWKLEPFRRVVLSAMLVRLVVGALFWLFRAKAA